jgi:hypothetical protein
MYCYALSHRIDNDFAECPKSDHDLESFFNQDSLKCRLLNISSSMPDMVTPSGDIVIAIASLSRGNPFLIIRAETEVAARKRF